MPRHREVRHLPYTAEQLFALVADVASYPEFLPWCVGARVHRATPDQVLADLWIGYQFIRECFTSEVQLTPPTRIDVQYFHGPFRYLENRWTFQDMPEGGCELDFYVDFEFKSSLLQRLIQFVFTEAVHKMVSSFEQRAQVLYPREIPINSLTTGTMATLVKE